MSTPLFTSLSPNVERDDVLHALGLLLKPWRWRNTQSTKKLEDVWKAFHNMPYAVAFSSGRNCLFEILNFVHLHPEDEVLLQAYTCVAVPNPILWTGATPIYVDCDRETLTLSPVDLRRKITRRSKVLIIQHTFGQPAALDELLEIAREHNLFVIEDCAHALGARYKGELVGTRGDASFFSLGRDKVLSSVFGGIALTKREDLGLFLQQAQQRTTAPPRLWVLQQLLQPILTSLAKTFYGVGLGKALLGFSKKVGLLSPPVETIERQGGKPHFLSYAFAGALAELALYQFRKLGRFNTHRTQRALQYRQALEGSFSTQVPLPDTNPTFLRYVLRASNVERIMNDAKREHVFLGDWYTTPIAPAQVNLQSIQYTECPNAEAVARQTINLPTDIHISEQDAERLITFLKRYV
ncbi:aminotransferase class I/II-fold pyridoxal phosphate-dependent enzyme [Patescibacteria group bacterium]|nr:aminotransferase class I/II-fold pyridoxal phosphate-dependent enzyme [Patescibacteria group bacterium]